MTTEVNTEVRIWDVKPCTLVQKTSEGCRQQVLPKRLYPFSVIPFVTFQRCLIQITLFSIRPSLCICVFVYVATLSVSNNVLITNEMHNSYNQILFHSFQSVLHVSNESSCSSSGARHNVLYYTVQSVQSCYQASLAASSQARLIARLYRLCQTV